jgi:hypothetical protein
MPHRFRSTLALLTAAAIGVAACGSSSKPSYCSSLTTLKTSVQSLPKTDVVANGTNALKTAADTVVKNAHQVVDSAKHDFPNETSAISSSVSALQSTISQLQKNASPALVAQAVGNATSVATAVKNFSSSASSKCD